jgi:hypothetical protein
MPLVENVITDINSEGQEVTQLSEWKKILEDLQTFDKEERAYMNKVLDEEIATDEDFKKWMEKEIGSYLLQNTDRNTDEYREVKEFMEKKWYDEKMCKMAAMTKIAETLVQLQITPENITTQNLEEIGLGKTNTQRVQAIQKELGITEKIFGQATITKLYETYGRIQGMALLKINTKEMKQTTLVHTSIYETYQQTNNKRFFQKKTVNMQN